MSEIKVVDAKTGEVREAPAEVAQQGFSTGALRLPKDIDVPLTGTDGKTSYFPAENVAKAIQEGGFKFASSKEQARMRAEDSPVLAFTENLANELAPIPGAVHGIQRLLGADPEDLEARSETNWGKGGSALGIAGSFLTGGIAGKAGTAAVKGARKLGTELGEHALERQGSGLLTRMLGGSAGGQLAADAAGAIEARTGKLAVDIVEPPFQQLTDTVMRYATPGAALDQLGRSATSAAERAIGTSIEGEIARKALANGLGRAVEGATYGVGHAIDEAALGRADLNAETILASAGAGGLVGGLRGAVGGALHEGIKRAAHNYVAEDITGKIAGSVAGHLATGGAGGSVAGRVVGQRVSQAIKSVPGLEGLAAFIQKSDDYLAGKIMSLAGRGAPQYRPAVEALTARTTLRMLGGSAEERRDAYDQRVSELSALQDPAVYSQHITPELEGLSEAPNHQFAASQLGQKMIGFLAQNMPAAQAGSTGQMDQLFHPERKNLAGRPNDRAIKDFAELDRLVQSPYHIFDLANRGLVRSVHVNALQAMYPQTLERIRAGLMRDLPEGAANLTALQKRSIKVLLGGEDVTPQQQQLRAQVFEPSQQPNVATPTPAQNRRAVEAGLTTSQRLEMS